VNEANARGKLLAMPEAKVVFIVYFWAQSFLQNRNHSENCN
jgi:hypothetical protein